MAHGEINRNYHNPYENKFSSEGGTAEQHKEGVEAMTGLQKLTSKQREGMETLRQALEAQRIAILKEVDATTGFDRRHGRDEKQWAFDMALQNLSDTLRGFAESEYVREVDARTADGKRVYYRKEADDKGHGFDTAKMYKNFEQIEHDLRDLPGLVRKAVETGGIEEATKILNARNNGASGVLEALRAKQNEMVQSDFEPVEKKDE